MTRIMCSVSSCVNYINSECTADTVKISTNGKSCNSINCDTYGPRTLRSAIKNAFNTDYFGVLSQSLDYRNDINHKIVCGCEKCTYNFANTCTSTDINIYGPEAKNACDTYCQTFLRKL